jgi:hypothetical protein
VSGERELRPIGVLYRKLGADGATWWAGRVGTAKVIALPNEDRRAGKPELVVYAAPPALGTAQRVAAELEVEGESGWGAGNCGEACS